MIKPNTFIVGAQKSATTSFYNWLAQHPEVCGPSSLKDYPFFIREEYFSKGIESLENAYLKEGYSNQKIVLQGYVNYMFEEQAIYNIHDFDPNAKLICILRNPTDRAISAYNFFKKLNSETNSLKFALENEEERMKGTQREKNNLTYKAHGLYSQQLDKIFSTFKRDQVLVLLYEDVSNNPEKILKQTFNFLNIDSSFLPNFNRLNTTGNARFNFLHDILFTKNRVKKFVVNKIIDPILPLQKRINIKLALINWNTKNKSNKSREVTFVKERQLLKEYFKEDILKLEKLINRNLDHWK